MNTVDVAVLVFGGRRVPRSLTGLAVRGAEGPAEIDAVVGACRRVVVVGDAVNLAAVLTRMLRTERLDVEVGYAPNRWAARRARCGAARRVPLIRDETGQAIVGSARWVPPGNTRVLHGEAVVDDTVLFDGDVAGVRIEPTRTLPGLRAAVVSATGRPGRWVPGRAAQLGSTGAVVLRDGVAAPHPVRRSVFYRHVQGWLLVH
ncbi:peptidase M50 [Mycobacterium sp.]|uniref:peptidase M50 n=1 Tax=Mycobacterium sp. TaxID=1785 RepID=UPI001280D0ED|nr:peptidase M50 [Mycobacterium sp.]KAA8957733.1 MAG: peptidase M50 [Mycobacterium sp.]